MQGLNLIKRNLVSKTELERPGLNKIEKRRTAALSMASFGWKLLGPSSHWKPFPSLTVVILPPTLSLPSVRMNLQNLSLSNNSDKCKCHPERNSSFALMETVSGASGKKGQKSFVRPHYLNLIILVKG